MDLLFEIAKSDGIIKPEEHVYLKNVSDIFGFNEKTFNQLFALHKIESNPFEILGANISDDINEIRKKWKEMVKNNHPDLLIGQGMPIEFIESANQKIAIINSAFEEIKKLKN